jgi:hypothetical protein
MPQHDNFINTSVVKAALPQTHGANTEKQNNQHQSYNLGKFIPQITFLN